MDKKRPIILDGTPEEQDKRFKEWLGLRPDQSYDDLVISEEELEKCRYNYKGKDTYAFVMSDRYILCIPKLFLMINVSYCSL